MRTDFDGNLVGSTSISQGDEGNSSRLLPLFFYHPFAKKLKIPRTKYKEFKNIN